MTTYFPFERIYELDLNGIKHYIEVEKGDVNVPVLTSPCDKEGTTILIQMVIQNRLDIVKYLVENGARINIANNMFGWTALVSAVYNATMNVSYFTMVNYLIDNGADIKCRFRFRNNDITLLRFAIERSSFYLAEILLNKGIKFDVRDLDFAKKYKRVDSDKKIIEFMSSQLISAISHREYLKIYKNVNFYLIDDLALIVMDYFTKSN